MRDLTPEKCSKCFRKSAIPVENSEELVLCEQCEHFSTGINFLEFIDRDDYVTHWNNESIKTLEVGSDWSVIFSGVNRKTIIIYMLCSIGFIGFGVLAVFGAVDAYGEGRGMVDIAQPFIIYLFSGIFFIGAYGCIRHVISQFFGFTRITAFGNRLEIYTGNKTAGDTISHIRNKIVAANYRQLGNESWQALQVYLFDPSNKSTKTIDLINNATSRDDHQKFLMEFLHKKINEEK